MELFYEDPYLKQADVEVLEKSDEYLVFNKTIFYPGGGGQPPDSGYFYGDNFRARIISAKRENGKIMHRYQIVEGNVGKSGKLAIDWERRYTLMKMHTGEHILYRALETLFPVKFQKVDFNENESTLYISGNVNLEDISRAEDLANEIIKRDLDVKTYYDTFEEIEKDVRIRRERIKDEKVRIVEIGGFDKSACTGIHVKKTGEIGMIFVKSIKRSNFLEIKFLAGEPAEKFIVESARHFRNLYSRFNIEQPKIEERFSNAILENEILKKNLFEISSKMFEFSSMTGRNGKIYYSDFPYADFKGVEKRARKLLENEKGMVIYGNESAGKIFILSSGNMETEKLKNMMKENNLKGGGQGNYFIISVPEKNFKEVFEKIMKIFL